MFSILNLPLRTVQHRQTKEKVLRVAAYCSVSTDSYAQLESLEAQKTHYENYISAGIDFVITKSISRFARTTTDCPEIARKLQALHILIYFEKENINTGSSENNKRSIQKRFENGTYKISYPPYGYAWDGKQMIINPEQAAVVKEIFTDSQFNRHVNYGRKDKYAMSDHHEAIITG